MNNWIGLLIAASLAIVAGVLNWQYLEQKTKEIEMVSFMAIADGQRLDAGDTFEEGHFAPVEIPRKNARYLEDTAVYFGDRHTVIGMKALRPYGTGDLILRQELRTPPAELNLAKDEMAMWVPVGGSSFVPSLITPGDNVSFYLPKLKSFGGSRRPTEPNQEGPPENPESVEDPNEWNFDGVQPQEFTADSADLIGPFRVVSVGKRLGSDRVSRASGQRAGQDNNLGIAIRRLPNGGFEPNAEKLRKRIIAAGFRHAGVLLHPRNK